MRVTLKLATSLDGRIATAAGESKWITGAEAREQGHRLRAAHALIAIGVETAIADDPELTVRLTDYGGTQPTRVVFDSRQRLPLDGKLVATARAHATAVVTTGEPDPVLRSAGVRILHVAGEDGRPAIGPALDALADLPAKGDLLVEGGGRLAASFLQADAVDRIEWFRAPLVLGEEGRPGVGPLGLKILAAAPRFVRTHVEALGDDLWERYERL